MIFPHLFHLKPCLIYLQRMNFNGLFIKKKRFYQKKKCEHAIGILPHNSTLRYVSPKLKTGSPLFMSVHSCTPHSSQSWKQFKCPSRDKWRNKLSYIRTMKYYLVIKRNEVLILYNMDFKNMLRERSQAKKGHVLCDFFYMKCLE